MQEDFRQGGFTLPGEAGYEQLTLELARKWGADVIRDSDGTKLSGEILEAGYRIYSTICIIRQHNEFASAHPDAQQQTFLYSQPVTAEGETLVIDPMAGYFDEQFQLNDSADAMPYWQVWDRTAGILVPAGQWACEGGKVTVTGCAPWHEYSVSFLAWRIWEEINMYNHTTNSWTSEHLRQLDPRHPEAWAYLQDWLEKWCVANPDTDVVRLTSLFYNFVWIFGSDMRIRNRYTDWASYDFTVSPAALRAFEKEYGYALTAEDFVNQGKLQVTHMPPTAHKRDYMDFMMRFVAEKAKRLVEIIHKYGKQAYVFYDDSWVGMEPYGPYFPTVGFDGLIKCVFSGFECRLCAGARVPVHELRFHPYLFPVGLGGLPTFAEGGHPADDAMAYWKHVRRALVRQSVDRIGLGGYLHLTLGFPEFNDAIEQMGIEFRRLKALHSHGAPYALPIRVSVLHTWGGLRPWTLSGHFHETYMHTLIHINESLSGLPVQVSFIDFAQAKGGALAEADVVINAGRAGDAWSGGEAWSDPGLTAALTEFVHNGGVFIGVNEPTAAPGGHTFFRMAHVLGIDLDTGARVCHGRWSFDTDPRGYIIPEGMLAKKPHLYLTDGKAEVLASADGIPQMTVHPFGKGYGVYMTDFAYSEAATRLLLSLLTRLTGSAAPLYVSDHTMVEAGYFPADRTLVAMNSAAEPVTCSITTENGPVTLTLAPNETRFMELQ